ncbi:MAG: hypothetical protein Q8N79_02235 [Candidatus Methanoperedens sp.]|nr:hypothetical protein [Candidatus Methanoperedens sp.]
MQQTKILLDENDIPKKWYNILPDTPTPLFPPLNPATKEPISPKDLSPIFPMELIRQEVSHDRFIPIPDEVRDIYALWRPSLLYRAHRLEAALKTLASIYYKYEGVSPAGSHKPNTAIAQTYYNMKEGIQRLATEYVPPAIHAGGLRYHGDSPIVSQLYADKVIDAVAYHQTEVFEAAVTFARSEGIVPAPESAHAIKCAIDKALECRKSGEIKTILFNLSGHGHFDMGAYDSYFSGNMFDEPVKNE